MAWSWIQARKRAFAVMAEAVVGRLMTEFHLFYRQWQPKLAARVRVWHPGAMDETSIDEMRVTR
jgi:hypothetical protein